MPFHMSFKLFQIQIFCERNWHRTVERLTSANHFYIGVYSHIYYCFRVCGHYHGTLCTQFLCRMVYFWKCTFKVWNPTIYQATDFACQVLCGMNFWVDKLQTLLLSATNVACHKIVIWFHLLLIFWIL